MMNAEKWEDITRMAHCKVAEYFESRENQVILDFIKTVEEDIPAIIEELAKRKEVIW